MANVKTDDMGISRSGRVRKKSSKLLDYESSEEADVRPRKASQGAPKPKSKKIEVHENTVPPLQIRLPKHLAQTVYKTNYDDNISSEDNEDHSSCSDKMEFANYYDSNSHLDDLNSHADDFENGDFDKEIADEKNISYHESGEGEEDESDNQFDINTDSDGEVDIAKSSLSDQTQTSNMSKQPSLYLQENARKKVTVKDGKVVATKQKAQRKDKGKTRFTAYMLWSKEMRPAVSSQNPDLKFEGVSKRLGELWSAVSPAERMTWKRRAMRMAAKASGGMISTGAPPQGPRIRTTVSPKRTMSARSVTKLGSPHKPHQTFTGQEVKSVSDNESLISSAITVPPRSFELEALDVATHLHLLGESLSLIGARLKERDGQIAVSGSLSVLLDSMLCALGPLLCLTRLTPETNVVPSETLSRILDNIAYIMPGL